MPFDQVFPWMQGPPVIGWLLKENEISESAVPNLVEVKAGEGYRIWLRCGNGVSGELDLSYLSGKGVFKAWDNIQFFKGVYLLPYGEGITWSEELDMCADALYLELTALSPEGLFPPVRQKPVNA
jgi:hypothetical protein